MDFKFVFVFLFIFSLSFVSAPVTVSDIPSSINGVNINIPDPPVFDNTTGQVNNSDYWDDLDTPQNFTVVNASDIVQGGTLITDSLQSETNPARTIDMSSALWTMTGASPAFGTDKFRANFFVDVNTFGIDTSTDTPIWDLNTTWRADAINSDDFNADSGANLFSVVGGDVVMETDLDMAGFKLILENKEEITNAVNGKIKLEDPDNTDLIIDLDGTSPLIETAGTGVRFNDNVAILTPPLSSNAFRVITTKSSSFTTAFIKGVTSGSGTKSDMRGLTMEISPSGTGGTITLARGGYFVIQPNSNDETLVTGESGYFRFTGENGKTMSITNARAAAAFMDAEETTITNGSNYYGYAPQADGGSIGTFAHLWLEDPTGVAGATYSILSWGGDANFTKGNIETIGNITGKGIYGEIWSHNSTVINLKTVNVAENISELDSTYNNGFNFNGNETLTALVRGLYDTSYSVSLSGTANSEFDVGIAINGETTSIVNGNNMNKTHSHRTIGTNNQVRSMGGGGNLCIAINDRIVLMIMDENSPINDATIINMQLNLMRIGDC